MELDVDLPFIRFFIVQAKGQLILGTLEVLHSHPITSLHSTSPHNRPGLHERLGGGSLWAAPLSVSRGVDNPEESPAIWQRQWTFISRKAKTVPLMPLAPTPTPEYMHGVLSEITPLGDPG